MEHMRFLFDKNFLIRHSTHNPLMHAFQMPFTYRDVVKTASPETLKFLGGSNILKLHLMRPLPDWNINLFTKRLYRNSVCIGAGLEGDLGTEDLISRIILPSVLSKKYIHSVHDSSADKYLKDKGFKVINTGCPTLWNLTPEHCKKIPKNKHQRVIFTSITLMVAGSIAYQVIAFTGVNAQFTWSSPAIFLENIFMLVAGR